MEFSQVQTYTDQQASISGPNASSFNGRASLDLASRIRNNWASGRQTAPQNGSIIYAPDGTEGVSLTYFNERAAHHAAYIEFFVGPAVSESVYGKAWGIHGNISCNPVHKKEYTMLRIDRLGGDNFSINGCVIEEGSCQPQWYSNVSELDSRTSRDLVTILLWLNETGRVDMSTYEYVAAADGFFDLKDINGSPYIQNSNHDNSTFDHIFNHREQDDITIAMFEISFWQSNSFNDDVAVGLVNGAIQGPVDVDSILGRDYIRIGVHCDLISAVGFAELDPVHRTFSSFRRSKAEPVTQVPNAPYKVHIEHDFQPPQILALQALANERNAQDTYGSLTPINYRTAPNEQQRRQTWSSFHNSIGSLPLPADYKTVTGTPLLNTYHVLTPRQLQLCVYKLLGESFVAMMDAGGVEIWHDDLYRLGYKVYLVPGVVSWKIVLTLLGVWAVVMSAGAIWMLFFGGKRWAKTLDGLKMFKLGAQFTDKINGFESINLEGCRDVLGKVSGMIGMLSGTGAASITLGFIGLSENVASQEVRYILDRRQAAPNRPLS